MITYIIIGITVVVSYLCFNNQELFRKLALIPYRTVKNNEWYRLVTHGFVHADMTHLLVNMFTFWSFGTYIESIFGYLGFGTWGYLGLYFGGMVFASVYDVLKHHNDPYYVSIGASGAVSAILFSSILSIRGVRYCCLPLFRFRELSSVCSIWLIVNIWLNVVGTISITMPIFTVLSMVFCTRLYLILR